MKSNALFVKKVNDQLNTASDLGLLQIKINEYNASLEDLQKEAEETPEYEELKDAKDTLKTVKDTIKKALAEIIKNKDQYKIEFGDDDVSDFEEVEKLQERIIQITETLKSLKQHYEATDEFLALKTREGEIKNLEQDRDEMILENYEKAKGIRFDFTENLKGSNMKVA